MQALKRDIGQTRPYGAWLVSIGGRMLPNEDCYMEMMTGFTDKVGIPVARFHWRLSGT